MNSNMEKRKYTSPQTKIAQVDASEILVIIANSETDTQWAPQHHYDEESSDSEGNDDCDNRTISVWK